MTPGYNPARLLEPGERPKLPRSETRCLEVPEAAFLLEAARTYPVKTHEPEMALAYLLLAAFLLTGGRAKEVLGFRLHDLSTDRNTVTFRPNEFHEGGRLLFRSPHITDREAPLSDLRDLLDRVAVRAGLEGGGDSEPRVPRDLCDCETPNGRERCARGDVDCRGGVGPRLGGDA